MTHPQTQVRIWRQVEAGNWRIICCYDSNEVPGIGTEITVEYPLARGAHSSEVRLTVTEVRYRFIMESAGPPDWERDAGRVWEKSREMHERCLDVFCTELRQEHVAYYIRYQFIPLEWLEKANQDWNNVDWMEYGYCEDVQNANSLAAECRGRFPDHHVRRERRFFDTAGERVMDYTVWSPLGTNRVRVTPGQDQGAIEID